MSGTKLKNPLTTLEIRSIILSIVLVIVFISAGIRFTDFIRIDASAVSLAPKSETEPTANYSADPAVIYEEININTATAAQLEQLKGIGEVKAQAIVFYRQSIGAFTCKEDIMDVSGIGPGIYEDISEFIYVE